MSAVDTLASKTRVASVHVATRPEMTITKQDKTKQNKTKHNTKNEFSSLVWFFKNNETIKQHCATHFPHRN
jgi:hypothetical protein